MRLSDLSVTSIIAVLSALLFISFIGSVPLFDGNEVDLAESAREMVITNDYSTPRIDNEVAYENSPVPVWLQAISMNLFGINEFASRFPNVMCGIITVLVLIRMGKKIFSIEFGLLWVLLYVGSLIPHLYFKSATADPWFNLFLFSSMYYFILFIEKETTSSSDSSLLLSAFFTGLAMLTKGTVLLLVVLLFFLIYWIYKRFNSFISVSQLFVYIIVSAVLGWSWFMYELWTGKIDFFAEYMNYLVSMSGTSENYLRSTLYCCILLFIGGFPSSILVFRLGKQFDSDNSLQKDFKTWMLLALLVTFVLSLIVPAGIADLFSFAFLPLTFLAAYCVNKIINYEMGWKSWMTTAVFMIGSLWALILTLFPRIDVVSRKGIFKWLVSDKSLLASLDTPVEHSAIEFLAGPALFVMLLMVLYRFKKREPYKSVLALISVLFLFVLTSVWIVIPKIEQYTQGVPVEFYKSLAGKECYVETIGFKSSTSLFYTQKLPASDPNSANMSWLMNEAVDRPVYFVGLSEDMETNKRLYPGIEELYSKGGFTFYRKK